MARFDEDKTLAAMLYLAEKAGGINLYALVKTLYQADKEHLKRWGRTITGDAYVRMRYGPVPSAAYDMLKSVRGDQDWRNDLTGFFRVAKNTVTALTPPETDQFSRSDVEVLDWAFDRFARQPFEQNKKDAHDDAYKANPGQLYMTLKDLAEGDRELIEHIRQQADDEARLGI